MSRREITPPATVDRISALPDEMLIHILSFLPTKLAFTTTVLSKRWTPLCNSLTTLRFGAEAIQDVEGYPRCFRPFVYDLLLSPRVQHQPLQTFCLLPVSNCLVGWPSTLFVDKLLEAAKRRRVENVLLLTISTLSATIFTSSTLVVLKLSGAVVIHDVESVHLPLLRTLHLINISFRKKEHVKKILSGCPILMDLNASVSDSVSELYSNTRGYKSLPNLVKARIRAFEVPFSAVYNVQFLRIEMMERRCSDKYIDSYYREIPVFKNLISIELCFSTRFSGWDRVVEVLTYCSKLQTLVIEKPFYKQFYNGKWEYTEPVPECVSLHLRTCSIRNYRGWDDDFIFAEFILLNASVLQAMTLHSAPYTVEDEKDRFFKHLSGCPRISVACKIECK